MKSGLAQSMPLFIIVLNLSREYCIVISVYDENSVRTAVPDAADKGYSLRMRTVQSVMNRFSTRSLSRSKRS
jgi:hypothetical protein